MPDAVILAAGNGARLRGVVAAGMKPLLVVDGEALVHRLVRQAIAAGCRRIVVVVSPVNAAAVCDVIESNEHEGVRYVIQPSPTGPGDALRRGLELTSSEAVLVLLGDNILQDNDVTAMASARPISVGVKHFSPGEESTVKLLTRLRPDGSTVEKIPVSFDDLWPDGKYHTWYGPLMVDSRKAWMTLSDAKRKGPELFIGPLISKFGSYPGGQINEVKVDAHDVGYAKEDL